MEKALGLSKRLIGGFLYQPLPQCGLLLREGVLVLQQLWL